MRNIFIVLCSGQAPGGGGGGGGGARYLVSQTVVIKKVQAITQFGPSEL